MVTARPAHVAFAVQDGPTERLAAVQVGVDAHGDALYRVISVPYLVPDVSYGDVVLTRERQDVTEYVSTRARSDLTVIAVRVLRDDPEADDSLMAVAEHWGMRFEVSGPLRAFASDTSGALDMLAHLAADVPDGWCEYTVMADRLASAEADARSAPAL